MSLNPVDSAFTISSSSSSAKSSAFAHKTDSIRVIAIGNDAYVSVGGEPTAAATNFLVTTTGGPEVISLGHVRSHGVAGITTGATTIIDFPEGTGSPFEVGDYVSLTVTGQSAYDFSHKEVIAVDKTASVDGYFNTRITVANNSSSGNPSVLTGNAVLRNSLKIAVRARTGTGSVHCQQVQVTG